MAQSSGEDGRKSSLGVVVLREADVAEELLKGRTEPAPAGASGGDEP